MAISECGIDTLDEEAQEKKAHGDYAFPIAIYRDILEQEEVPWHWHVELELILVTDGEGYFSCNENTHLLQAGQGIFINAGNLHSCKVSSKGHCELHSIVFHPRLVTGGNDSVFWIKYLQPLTENKNFDSCCLNPEEAWEKKILDRIACVWEKVRVEETDYEFSVRSDLSEIALLLFHNMKNPESENLTPDIRKTSRLKIMMEFIQANYREDLKISDISDAAMVSESECQRCFKNVLHTTPIKYLTNLRMQKACELLAGTELAAAKVAEQCGFSDNSYFGKLFKKEMGLTPVEYREERRSGG